MSENQKPQNSSTEHPLAHCFCWRNGYTPCFKCWIKLKENQNG